MPAKLIIYGLSNTGKTTLLNTLEDALVISYDNKTFSLPMPHINVEPFEDLQEYINQIGDGLIAYKESYGKNPKILVFDTLSSVCFKILEICNTNYSNYNIHTENNKNLARIRDFIEFLAATYDIVILSHCILNEDTNKMAEPISGRQFKSVGGFLASVDYSCYLELVKKKRIIHLKNHELARTLLPLVEESMNVDDFNLNDYLNKIREHSTDASKFNLNKKTI